MRVRDVVAVASMPLFMVVCSCTPCVAVCRAANDVFEACDTGYLAALKAAVDAGGDVHGVDGNGDNPLHRACRSGHTLFVQSLIDVHKVSPLSVNQYGRTAMHCAASQGHVALVKMLHSRYQVPVDAVTRTGWAALHHAVLHGHVGTVAALLLDCSCDMGIVDATGNTALHYAFEWGQATCALLLLSLGADPYARNHVGKLPVDLIDDFPHHTRYHWRLLLQLMSLPALQSLVRGHFTAMVRGMPSTESLKVLPVLLTACRGKSDAIRLVTLDDANATPTDNVASRTSGAAPSTVSSSSAVLHSRVPMLSPYSTVRECTDYLKQLGLRMEHLRAKVAVVGLAGAGKSSFIRLLADKPRSESALKADGIATEIAAIDRFEPFLEPPSNATLDDDDYLTVPEVFAPVSMSCCEVNGVSELACVDRYLLTTQSVCVFVFDLRRVVGTPSGDYAQLASVFTSIAKFNQYNAELSVVLVGTHMDEMGSTQECLKSLALMRQMFDDYQRTRETLGRFSKQPLCSRVLKLAFSAAVSCRSGDVLIERPDGVHAVLGSGGLFARLQSSKRRQGVHAMAAYITRAVADASPALLLDTPMSGKLCDALTVACEPSLRLRVFGGHWIMPWLAYRDAVMRWLDTSADEDVVRFTARAEHAGAVLQYVEHESVDGSSITQLFRQFAIDSRAALNMLLPIWENETQRTAHSFRCVAVRAVAPGMFKIECTAADGSAFTVTRSVDDITRFTGVCRGSSVFADVHVPVEATDTAMAAFLNVVGGHGSLACDSHVLHFLGRGGAVTAALSASPSQQQRAPAARKTSVLCCGGAGPAVTTYGIDTRSQVTFGPGLRRASTGRLRKLSFRRSGSVSGGGGHGGKATGADGSASLGSGLGSDTHEQNTSTGLAPLRAPPSTIGHLGTFKPLFEYDPHKAEGMVRLRGTVTSPEVSTADVVNRSPNSGSGDDESKSGDAAAVVSLRTPLPMSVRPPVPPQHALHLRFDDSKVDDSALLSAGTGTNTPIAAKVASTKLVHVAVVLDVNRFKLAVESVLLRNYVPHFGAKPGAIDFTMLPPAIAAIQPANANHLLTPSWPTMPFMHNVVSDFPAPSGGSVDAVLASDEALFCSRGVVRRQFLYEALWSGYRALGPQGDHLFEHVDVLMKDVLCHMLEKLHVFVLAHRAANAANDLLLCPFNITAVEAPPSWYLPLAGGRSAFLTNNCPVSVGPVLRRQFTKYHFPAELYPLVLFELFGEGCGRLWRVAQCSAHRVLLQSPVPTSTDSCHVVRENVWVWQEGADVSAIQTAVLDPKYGVVRYITKPAPLSKHLSGVALPTFEQRLKDNIGGLQPGHLNVLAWHSVEQTRPAVPCAHLTDVEFWAPVSAALCRGVNADGETGSNWAIFEKVLGLVNKTFAGEWNR